MNFETISTGGPQVGCGRGVGNTAGRGAGAVAVTWCCAGFATSFFGATAPAETTLKEATLSASATPVATTNGLNTVPLFPETSGGHARNEILAGVLPTSPRNPDIMASCRLSSPTCSLHERRFDDRCLLVGTHRVREVPSPPAACRRRSRQRYCRFAPLLYANAGDTSCKAPVATSKTNPRTS